MDTSNFMERITELKRSTGAFVLAHNYVVPEIQDVADVVADSLVLARCATEVENDIILVAGVDFMAESVKILSPQKKIIHINPGAVCPMAHMAEALDFLDFKKLYPNVPSVAYVNTTAELKTHVNYCCTSANAVQIIKAIDSQRVIFLPDINLGNYIQSQVPEKEIITWPGHCHVHHGIKLADVQKMKDEHPDAQILAHPECKFDVIEMADVVASTEGILKYAQGSNSKEFIITTEEGLVYRLRKLLPDKIFHALPLAVCTNMKKMSINDLIKALEELGPEIELSEDILTKAKLPLERMVTILG